MQKPRILIVSDVPGISKEIRKFLVQIGYEISGIASSGEAAIKHTEEHTPDIILIDIEMKGEIDGMEAAENLKKNLNVPIIYLTDYSDKNTIERAKASPPNGYILKPFTVKEIETSIEIALQNHSVERKLRESEANYRRVVENATEAIFITDKNGNIKYANPAGLKVSCYTLDELKKLNYLDIASPEYRKRLQFHYMRQFLKLKPVSYIEYPYINKEGKTLWLAQNSTLRMEGDKVIGFEIVTRDITERKNMEVALRSSEERYRIITENTSDLIAITTFDRKVKYLYLSPSNLRLLGYKPEEWLGKSALDAIHPEDKKRLAPLLGRYINMKKNILLSRRMSEIFENIEYRMKDKTGEWRWLQSTVNVIDDRLLFVTKDITDRKRTEKELQESERKYKTIVEDSSIGIYYNDFSGNFLYGNKKAEELIGYKREELIGKNFLKLKLLDATGISRAIKLLALNRIGKPTGPDEFRLVRKDGTQITVEISTRMLTINQQKVVMGMVQDITERLRMEKMQLVLYRIANSVNTAKNMNELYKTIHSQLGIILNTTNFYIALYDKDTGIIQLPYVVDEKTEIIHFPAKKTLTYHLIKNNKPLLVTEKEISGMVETGEVELVSSRPQVWLGVPLEVEGEVVGAVVLQSYTDPHQYTNKDLELLKFVSKQIALAIERKRSEEAIRDAEEKYRSLIENSDDAVYLLVDDKFEVINKRFSELFGLKIEEIQSPDFDFRNLVAPESMEIIEERERIITQGESPPSQYEFTVVSKKGKRIEVQASVTYVPYKGKTATQGIIRDLTERKRLEDQLRQAQKQEAIGALAGGIAHDFNNLLAGIMGSVELAMKKLGQGHTINELLERAAISAERASELTSQLLAFGSQRMEKPLPLNINECIDEAFQLLRRTISPLVEMKSDKNPSVRTVKGDAGQLSQVLINLILNARDAMPEGGVVLVKSDNVTIDQDYSANHPETEAGEYICLSVCDNGVGIPSDVLPHIFDPFFTTKDIGEGTGLGLAMVYGIVKGHEGWIDVESAMGRGTTFKLYFPTVEEKPAHPVELKASDMVGDSETILLVDDEAVVREMGKSILESFGYKVLLANDGFEAMQVYEKMMDKIELVILDLLMPKRSGKEILKELLITNPNLKIIISSGYSQIGVIQNLLEIGARGFIPKPYHINEMLSLIRKVLEGK